MARTLKNMMRQRSVDRPAMLRELIRNNAHGKDAESLLAEFESLGTPWEPPARFAPKTEAAGRERELLMRLRCPAGHASENAKTNPFPGIAEKWA